MCMVTCAASARAGTHLLDEGHEAVPEAPGLVAVALQRADGDLLRLLHCHGNHVHGVVHERSVRLQEEEVGVRQEGE